MNTQEQLQQIFSKWSADDLNRLLHLSNGDCGRAINSIIQHERSGLPPEFFLTRDNDTAGRGGEAYPSPPPASSSAAAMNNNSLILRVHHRQNSLRVHRIIVTRLQPAMLHHQK